MAATPLWLIHAIEQFQAKQFFQGASKEVIATQIIAASSNDYFGNILALQEDPMFPQILCSYDTQNVWFIEDAFILGSTPPFKDGFYMEVFKRLVAISNGKFAPSHIDIESCGCCKGRDERINIQFQLKNSQADVNFCADLDVLVLSFLMEINEHLKEEACSFEVIQDPYGPCFVLFLTQNQKKWLTKTFHWSFEIYPNYWLDRAQYARQEAPAKTTIQYFEKALPFGNPFTVSEYADFLLDQGLDDAAVKVYKFGIQQLKKIPAPSDTQIWWLNLFEETLKKIIH